MKYKIQYLFKMNIDELENIIVAKTSKNGETTE